MRSRRVAERRRVASAGTGPAASGEGLGGGVVATGGGGAGRFTAVLTLVALVAGMVAGSLAAVTPDVITNGGFDQQLAGWLLNEGVGAYSTRDRLGGTGSVFGESGGAEIVVEQCVELDGEPPMELRAWVLLERGGADVVVDFFPSPGCGGTLVDRMVRAALPGGGWQELRIRDRYAVPALSANVMLIVGGPVGATSRAFFDDVSLELGTDTYDGNLLVNAGFDDPDPAEDWGGAGQGGTEVYFGPDRQGRAGSSLLFKGTLDPFSSYRLLAQCVPVEPDTRYVWGAFIRNLAGVGRVTVDFYGSPGCRDQVDLGGGSQTVPGPGWARSGAAATSPPGAVTASVQLVAVRPQDVPSEAPFDFELLFDDVVFAPGLCLPDYDTLCLVDGRYRVEARWRGPSEPFLQDAGAVEQSDAAGYFWFFQPDNAEVTIKVLPGGCSLNQRTWVFAAATTNVQVLLEVEDLLTGETWTAENPLGTPFEAIQDLEALEGCGI